MYKHGIMQMMIMVFLDTNTHYMAELLVVVGMTTATTMKMDTAKAMTAMATVIVLRAV